MDMADVITGAQRIAASLGGPFGRRKFQPVVVEHLDYFKSARASGALWTQIAEALARAGVRAADGKPYRANILRALVSRAEHADHSSQMHSEPMVAPKRTTRNTSKAASASIPSPLTPVPKQTFPNLSPDTASGHFDEIRNRIARASRLRGLGKSDT